MLKRGRKTGSTKSGNAARVFGDVLKEIREGKDIPQERLAFDAGLHRTHISQLERATKQPTLQTLLSIAAALDVPAHQIVRQVEERLQGLPKRTKQ